MWIHWFPLSCLQVPYNQAKAVVFRVPQAEATAFSYSPGPSLLQEQLDIRHSFLEICLEIPVSRLAPLSFHLKIYLVTFPCIPLNGWLRGSTIYSTPTYLGNRLASVTTRISKHQQTPRWHRSASRDHLSRHRVWWDPLDNNDVLKASDDDVISYQISGT